MAPRIMTLGCALALAAASAMASSEGVLLQERQLPGWEVVHEAAADVSRDPDLLEWGVLEKHVRHYTRDLRGSIEVCSIELWAFRSASQARAASAGFQFPDWQIHREGSLLVMVHGLVSSRGHAPQRGVFPECDHIGSRIRARAATQSHAAEERRGLAPPGRLKGH